MSEMSDRNLDEYKKEEREKAAALDATPEMQALRHLQKARDGLLEYRRLAHSLEDTDQAMSQTNDKIVQGAATMMATPEYAAWELAKQALDFQKVCGCHHCADGIQALNSEVKQLRQEVQIALAGIIEMVSYDPSSEWMTFHRRGSKGDGDIVVRLTKATTSTAVSMSSAAKDEIMEAIEKKEQQQ